MLIIGTSGSSKLYAKENLGFTNQTRRLISNCLYKVVVRVPVYNTMRAGLTLPKQLLFNSPTRLSYLLDCFVNGYLGKVNCGNPGFHIGLCPQDNWFLPTTASKGLFRGKHQRQSICTQLNFYLPKRTPTTSYHTNLH